MKKSRWAFREQELAMRLLKYSKIRYSVARVTNSFITCSFTTRVEFKVMSTTGMDKIVGPICILLKDVQNWVQSWA